MAAVPVLQGLFQYKDANGVTHDVAALQGAAGKNAYQYALDSGLIPDTMTEQEYATACGRVYSELKRIQEAGVTLYSLGVTQASIENARDRIETAVSQAASANQTAQQNAAALEGTIAQAESRLSAVRAAEAAANSAAAFANSAAAGASVYSNIQAQVSALTTGQPPAVSTHQITDVDDNPVGLSFDFAVPVMDNAVVGHENGMMIISGQTMSIFQTSAQSKYSLSCALHTPSTSVFNQIPTVVYTLQCESYVTDEEDSEPFDRWVDLGLQDADASSFTVGVSNTQNAYWIANLSYIAYGASQMVSLEPRGEILDQEFEDPDETSSDTQEP